ncbi:DUF1572 family protein [Ascidiimonas aurantiaca]|uniref:DUF1572 family protein n=1 Tax=Ascidiimonas aurantiaca TaxID=1685432 RepID=UPI0030EB5BD7
MVITYLESVHKQFQYYKLLGDKVLERLTVEEMHWQYHEGSNSIATIVKHLHGNMLSRWTDFLTTDGEKEWRDRDGEFKTDKAEKEKVIDLWEEGWACLFAALPGINSNNFAQTVYIRNMGHTVVAAVNRQLAHYAYHVGQLVYLAKMIKGENWESLSIPKNQSEVYNQDKFSKPRREAHFTDDLLKKNTPEK